MATYRAASAAQNYQFPSKLKKPGLAIEAIELLRFRKGHFIPITKLILFERHLDHIMDDLCIELREGSKKNLKKMEFSK